MKIVVGGQIDKDIILTHLKIFFPVEDIQVKTDLEAAMAVKNGQADLYFGACNTGGGGALAMAIALLGMSSCVPVSIPGKIMSDKEIIDAVESGKKAFGMNAQDIPVVMPILCQAVQKFYQS